MMPDPISDAELDAILNRNRVNGSVSMLRPLEIYVPRDGLLELVRTSLLTMQAARKRDEESPTQAKAADRAVQQRIDFLAWLQGQPEQVYLAMYPVSLDGLTDDDVLDVLEDDTMFPF